MLRKPLVTLLVILTALPFTAPFATCSVTSLFEDAAAPAPHQAPLASTLEDGSLAHALPLLASSSRSRARSLSRVATNQAVVHLCPPVGRVAHAVRVEVPLPARPPLAALRI
jgi:hypothetical protein